MERGVHGRQWRFDRIGTAVPVLPKTRSSAKVNEPGAAAVQVLDAGVVSGPQAVVQESLGATHGSGGRGDSKGILATGGDCGKCP